MNPEVIREIAKNPSYIDAAKILNFIESRGGHISHRELLRHMYHIKSRDLRELMLTLIDADVVESVSVKMARGPSGMAYSIPQKQFKSNP